MTLSSDAIVLPKDKHMLERDSDGEGSSILRTPDSTELIERSSEGCTADVPEDVVKR